MQNIVTWFANVQTKDTRFQWQVLPKCNANSTVNTGHSELKGLLGTGGRKQHPQILSISYHTSLDRTNSSNENVFLACPKWKHFKPESLCYSFYCDCKTLLTSSNIKILSSVPQLSYRMNKFCPLTLQTKH